MPPVTGGNTMNLSKHTPMRAVLAALCVITSLLAATSGFAAEPAKDFNIPAAAASTMLKQFSSQSGKQLLYSADDLAGVKLAPVQGNLTPREALDRMIDGTSLRVSVDQQNGAMTLTRANDPNAPRAARTASARPTSQSKLDDDKLTLETYSVMGLRDTGLINQGVVPRDDKGAIAFTIIGQQELERSGASDVSEVLRTLPQVASFQSAQQFMGTQTLFAGSGAGVTPATRVDLRGFGNQGTTFLVNGRRMPIVRETQGGGPDISRIPLSAVDHIEVLPSSAGGLYGTNTTGGVINIVLKRNYAGRELTVNYGVVEAGGSSSVNLTYIEGRSLFGGKGNLTWTLDLRDRGAMYYGDRPLYRRFLDRNLSPLNGGTVASWISSGAMINFIPRPGVFTANDLGVSPLNIPGATSPVLFAQVPTGSDGKNLTPASFLATANKLNITEPMAGLALYNPEKSVSFNATYNHELKKDRLYWYTEVGLGHTEYNFTTPASPTQLLLTIDDPRNPFRANPAAGYAGQQVRYFYVPSDIPGTEQITKNDTIRLVLGLNGTMNLFGRDWKWALDGSTDYNRRYAFGYVPGQMLSQVSGSNANSRLPGAIALYAPVSDHDAFPNPTAANLFAKSSWRENSDFVWLSELVARASGDVIDLPAGPMQASLVAEGRSQNYANTFENKYDMSILNPLGIADPGSSSPSVTSRESTTFGSELVVPLLGKRATVLGINSASLVGAYTYNTLTDAKGFDTANAGIFVTPVPDVTLRASFGAGTYPPGDSASFTATTVLTDIVGATTADPRRGGTAIGNYTQRTGGNPDLVPEETRTWNFGLILQPRFLKGFSASFDYGYIHKVHAIQSLSLSTLLNNEIYYPERITRAAPTAADQALGWAGQIQLTDLRRINIGHIWSQYLDTTLRYRFETTTAGNFEVLFRSTNTREFRTKLRPESVITDTLDQIDSPLKFKGYGSITWLKNRWIVAVSANYIEGYRDSLNLSVDNSLTTNLQVSYNVPASGAGERGWRNWLSGTQWTLGCNNIADSEPPYVRNPGGQSLVNYYSTFDDPRGRNFFLRVKKTF